MLESLFNNVTGLQACNFIKKIQKQSSEVFYKKSCSKKFYNIHRKTPVQESLFVNVIGLQTCNFMKKRLEQRCFSLNIVKFLRKPTLKNTYEQLLLNIGVIHKGCPHKFGNFLGPPPPVQVCPHYVDHPSPPPHSPCPCGRKAGII